MVGGFPVVVGSCDDVPVILKQSGPTTWRRIDVGLPVGSSFTQAATIGNQLWVQGTSATGALLVYRRESGVWINVPVTSIPAGSLVVDLAGSSTGSVWMAGSRAGQATGWHITGDCWTEVPLPASVSAATLTALRVAGPSAYAVGREATKSVPKQGAAFCHRWGGSTSAGDAMHAAVTAAVDIVLRASGSEIDARRQQAKETLSDPAEQVDWQPVVLHLAGEPMPGLRAVLDGAIAIYAQARITASSSGWPQHRRSRPKNWRCAPPTRKELPVSHPQLRPRPRPQPPSEQSRQ